jgi:hypothetical protein
LHLKFETATVKSSPWPKSFFFRMLGTRERDGLERNFDSSPRDEDDKREERGVRASNRQTDRQTDRQTSGRNQRRRRRSWIFNIFRRQRGPTEEKKIQMVLVCVLRGVRFSHFFSSPTKMKMRKDLQPVLLLLLLLLFSALAAAPCTNRSWW